MQFELAHVSNQHYSVVAFAPTRRHMRHDEAAESPFAMPLNGAASRLLTKTTSGGIHYLKWQLYLARLARLVNEREREREKKSRVDTHSSEPATIVRQ
jgi:hypothetical protein